MLYNLYVHVQSVFYGSIEDINIFGTFDIRTEEETVDSGQ